MKRLILTVVLMVIFLVPQAYAQTEGGAAAPKDQTMPQKGMVGRPCMMMGEGQQMPMCMSMMKGMMSQGMMMRDVMQVMKDMMTIQEKIIKGVKPAEKKNLLAELSRMQGKVDQMMVEMRQMRDMKGPSPEGQPEKSAPAPHH